MYRGYIHSGSSGRTLSSRARWAPAQPCAAAPRQPQRKQTEDPINSPSPNTPIYEQITTQIKELILTGELQPGQKLPSIRALANGLRISAITTKRAYTDLEAQGFIETVQGKGSFVTGGNVELLREERRRQIEQRLMRLVDDARSADIGDDELREMMDLIMEGDAS